MLTGILKREVGSVAAVTIAERAINSWEFREAVGLDFLLYLMVQSAGHD